MESPTTNNSRPTAKFNFFFVFLLVVSCWLLIGATSASAQQLTEYTLLEPIPLDGTGVPSTTTNASRFLPGIFRLTLAIAGVLAVLRLIYAGIIYMSTDAYGSKSEAKGIIQDALWGLALTLFAWIIVATLIGTEDAQGRRQLFFNLSLPAQQLPENQNPPIDIGGPFVPGSGLTQEEAREILDRANIGIQGPINLTGIQQRTINELTSLKSVCGTNCEIIITSATGGIHATGSCSHRAGYKVDLKLTSTLTQYIESNYTRLPNRGDGAIMYQSTNGTKYAKESNHWDVAVTCP